MTVAAETETLECVNWPDECEGAVELRMALSGSGEPSPRCDKHWDRRLELEERLRADYPDSSTPPAWFDPANAGETWDYE